MQLDLRDDCPLHVPSVELQFPREIVLRPTLALTSATDTRSQRIALNLGLCRAVALRHVCRKWHLTLGSNSIGMGASSGTFFRPTPAGTKDPLHFPPLHNRSLNMYPKFIP